MIAIGKATLNRSRGVARPGRPRPLLEGWGCPAEHTKRLRAVHEGAWAIDAAALCVRHDTEDCEGAIAGRLSKPRRLHVDGEHTVESPALGRCQHVV